MAYIWVHLMVTQLVQNYPYLNGTLIFITVFTEVAIWMLSQSQWNRSVQLHSSYLAYQYMLQSYEITFSFNFINFNDYI